MNRMAYLKNVTTLKLDETRCNACGTCVDVCPQAVMKLQNRTVKIVERDACMECGACARNCPQGAFTVESGVGCAAAIINTALGRNKKACCT